MQLLDEILAQRGIRLIDDTIDAAKVIRGFHDIVHVDGATVGPNCVRFKDIARLILREPASLDAVGVVGQLNLNLMVDASGEIRFLLRPEPIQQRFRRVFVFVCAIRPLCAFGNAPRLADENGLRYLPACSVIAHRALGNAPALCCFRYGKIVHAARLLRSRSS